MSDIYLLAVVGILAVWLLGLFGLCAASAIWPASKPLDKESKS